MVSPVACENPESPVLPPVENVPAPVGNRSVVRINPKRPGVCKLTVVGALMITTALAILVLTLILVPCLLPLNVGAVCIAGGVAFVGGCVIYALGTELLAAGRQKKADEQELRLQECYRTFDRVSRSLDLQTVELNHELQRGSDLQHSTAEGLDEIEQLQADITGKKETIVELRNQVEELQRVNEELQERRERLLALSTIENVD